MNTENSTNVEATHTPDPKNQIGERLTEFGQKILSIRNIGILFFALLLIAIGYFMYSVKYFSHLNLSERSGILYLSTVVLVILYITVFVASYIYRMQLMQKYEEEYTNHRKRTQQIPKLFSVWILPIISILLVLAAQIATVPEKPVQSDVIVSEQLLSSAPSTESSQSSTTEVHIPYLLAFTVATSLILLMIGMELSYCAQEHPSEHRWFVLIIASMILDFVSYFILMVGLEAPRTGVYVHEMKAIYTFILGIASLMSSYFTITQARITDEVLNSRKEQNE